jgi:SAM-dependent methyltransferase
MTQTHLPAWAGDVLQCPDTGKPLRLEGDRLVTADGVARGRHVDGVLHLKVREDDPSIKSYRAAGGAHFHERSQVAYAMTTLDTGVYHAYLAEIRPEDTQGVIVDVGGGDGRNSLPWLEWGYERIVVVDPAGAALERLRARIATRCPEWLDRVLLIEADARALPLRSNVAARVFSIEALAYLNEDYLRGLGECARVMADDGQLLVADRDYEGALLTRLFYGGGVAGLLEQAPGRDVVDGTSGQSVRSRCFTADELAHAVSAAGLRVVASHGISALSLVLGYLHNLGRLAADDDQRLADVHRLLRTLGRQGSMRRSHVIVAERAPR